MKSQLTVCIQRWPASGTDPCRDDCDDPNHAFRIENERTEVYRQKQRATLDGAQISRNSIDRVWLTGRRLAWRHNFSL